MDSFLIPFRTLSLLSRTWHSGLWRHLPGDSIATCVAKNPHRRQAETKMRYSQVVNKRPPHRCKVVGAFNQSLSVGIVTGASYYVKRNKSHAEGGVYMNYGGFTMFFFHPNGAVNASQYHPKCIENYSRGVHLWNPHARTVYDST